VLRHFRHEVEHQGISDEEAPTRLSFFGTRVLRETKAKSGWVSSDMTG
jgi:hypothetical protein